MKKGLLGLGLVGFLAFAATPALASEGGAHGQGSWEITLTTDAAHGEFSPHIGYYVIDNLAVTALLGYETEKEEDSAGATVHDYTYTTLGVGAEYNVPMGGPVVPFVGLVLIHFSEEDDVTGGSDVSAMGVEVHGGAKLMVNSRGSVNLGLGYLMVSGDDAGADFDVSGLSLDLGFSVYF